MDSLKRADGQTAFDPCYLGFFECFNRRQYFEAHEVLEDLWRRTEGDKRDFYKGLIQTAAVFLKLIQSKSQPAARLAQRALSHLEQYQPTCEGLDVTLVMRLLQDVLDGRNLLAEGSPPRLELRRP
jgi:predicted metal-dependent hydrolase